MGDDLVASLLQLRESQLTSVRANRAAKLQKSREKKARRDEDALPVITKLANQMVGTLSGVNMTATVAVRFEEDEFSGLKDRHWKALERILLDAGYACVRYYENIHSGYSAYLIDNRGCNKWEGEGILCNDIDHDCEDNGEDDCDHIPTRTYWLEL